MAIRAKSPKFSGTNTASYDLTVEIGPTADSFTMTSRSVDIAYGDGLEYFSMPGSTSSCQSDQFAIPIQSDSSLNIAYMGVGIYENPDGFFLDARPESLDVYTDNASEPGSVLRSYSFEDTDYDFFLEGEYNTPDGTAYIPMDSKQITGDGLTLNAGTTYWIVLQWSSTTKPGIASNGGTSYPTARGIPRQYYSHTTNSWENWDDSSISIAASDAVAVFIVSQ